MVGWCSTRTLTFPDGANGDPQRRSPGCDRVHVAVGEAQRLGMSASEDSRHDPKRGRHKKHASQETQRWNREDLIPQCPSWMSADTYRQLAQMRQTA
jgi:hypothetical protein